MLGFGLWLLMLAPGLGLINATLPVAVVGAVLTIIGFLTRKSTPDRQGVRRGLCWLLVGGSVMCWALYFVSRWANAPSLDWAENDEVLMMTAWNIILPMTFIALVLTVIILFVPEKKDDTAETEDDDREADE